MPWDRSYAPPYTLTTRNIAVQKGRADVYLIMGEGVNIPGPKLPKPIAQSPFPLSVPCIVDITRVSLAKIFRDENEFIDLVENWQAFVP
jgi:hypothetical protein